MSEKKVKQRPGPGRPKIDPQMLKIPVGYKLPRWIVEWLRNEVQPHGAASAAVMIEAALRAHYSLKPPEITSGEKERSER